MTEVTQAEAFWAKVNRRGPNECWPWLAGKASTGYGRAWVNRVSRPAQQVAWELANGKPFPAGKLGLHSCDNPICVNPAHIWPGTQSENILDCAAKGRHGSKPKEVCKRGHALTPENRLPTTGGFTRCGECFRATNREVKRRSRARRKERQNG